MISRPTVPVPHHPIWVHVRRTPGSAATAGPPSIADLVSSNDEMDSSCDSVGIDVPESLLASNKGGAHHG
jgi:hypothetical protein